MNKILFSLLLCSFVVVGTVEARSYDPDTFRDEEVLTVTGERPLVKIELSEILITIEPDDFDASGRIAKGIDIVNEGNVACYLDTELQNVPADLVVYAALEYDYLNIGESTHLKIVVELTEQQEVSTFNFSILVIATLED